MTNLTRAEVEQRCNVESPRDVWCSVHQQLLLHCADERRATLLAAWDALGGHRRALQNCPTCGGTGEVHSHNPTCWACQGRGTRPMTDEELADLARETWIRTGDGFQWLAVVKTLREHLQVPEGRWAKDDLLRLALVLSDSRMTLGQLLDEMAKAAKVTKAKATDG